MSATNHNEAFKTAVLNIAGNNNELLVWAEHMKYMYSDSMKQHFPLMYQRVNLIINFCKRNKEVINYDLEEDQELLDLYTKEMGDFFSIMKKADGEEAIVFLRKFSAIIDEFQTTVNNRIMNIKPYSVTA